MVHQHGPHGPGRASVLGWMALAVALGGLAGAGIPWRGRAAAPASATAHTATAQTATKSSANSMPSGAAPSPSTFADQATETAKGNDLNSVRRVVEEFGRQMQKVSLQAPPALLTKAMQEAYGGLVSSPAVLTAWLADPTHAPGRLTSSPWPDRIAITRMEKVSDTRYQVYGEVIEITSVELQTGGQAAWRPVRVVVDKSNQRWHISEVALGPATPGYRAGPVTYRDDQYGFEVSLPTSWQGHQVLVTRWEGVAFDAQASSQKTVETGPLLLFRHPLWAQQQPRQDLPIMVFTAQQWDALQRDQFHIGAAPVNPRELARNQRYVFALPARYNFAFLPGYEEVEQMVNDHAVQAFALPD